MEKLRHWQKTNEGIYQFLVDDTKIGNMSFDVSKSSAIFKTNDYEILIKREGFWKNIIEIFNKSNELIGNIFFEKWYANFSVIEYKSKRFQFISRNNPLVEYAIIEEKEVILAYGLTTDNRQLKIKITSSPQNEDYFFDALLWFSFLPVALENLVDNFSFMTEMVS